MKSLWQKIVRVVLAILIVGVLSGCGDDGGGNSGSIGELKLSLVVSNISTSSIDFVLTANFNGKAPLWVDGHNVNTITFESDVPYHMMFLNDATRHCYQVGGYAIFNGPIWSDFVCAP